MKHLQLLASHITLEKYIKEHNTLRIDKFVKLYTYNGFQKNVMESFDKLYANTDFEKNEYRFGNEYSNYLDEVGYQIFFKTNSNTEYRIDIIPVKNLNSKIDSDFVWSISFTLSENPIHSEEYEKLTELFEEKGSPIKSW